MEKILQQILSKLDSLEKGQANLEKRQANLEKGQVATNEEIRLIHSQLTEHGAILGALQHASEVHKADMDNLTHQVSGVSGEVKTIRKVQTDHTEQLDRIESKVAGHDIKIEVLDRTKANKRKVK
jgi:predicted  nucleic acid-binding Zn-ribbon protein